MKLTPALKDYLWGGTKLRTDFYKQCDYDKIAESWELSCHKDGNSIVSDGEFKGKTLSEVIGICGKSILGTDCERFEEFPILIKLIDAKDNLSVQVHPDNEYALRVEGEYGKTEMWYIVDCDEGASLLYGFDKEISKEEFAKRIEDNTLLEVTNSVPVHKGDVFFIEAGTLHAIGKGIVIAEIQQNSNTTYRIYDYGRVGKDGKPRELHVDKAVEVTKLSPAKPYPVEPYIDVNGFSVRKLAECEYFKVNSLNVDASAEMTADEASFHHLLILNGEGTLLGEDTDIPFRKGDSIFIPAGFGKYTVKGTCTLIQTTI